MFVDFNKLYNIYNCSMFSKISSRAKCPLASVYLYNNYFLYTTMLIFREFFKTQSDQNIYQNAPNSTKFSKFSQGASICP